MEMKKKIILNCRLVAYGKKVKKKSSIRKDSSTAQFTVIRGLLSINAIYRFRISTVDMSGE